MFIFSSSLDEDGKCFIKINVAGGYIVRKPLKVIIRRHHSFFSRPPQFLQVQLVQFYHTNGFRWPTLKNP